MTREEKARAYDEALKKAKEIKEKIMYSHLSTESCKAVSEYIDTIIPELAESEDERIRKELKEAFEAYDIESTWNGIPIRSIFAWLEKQKEPLTPEEKMDHPLYLEGFDVGRQVGEVVAKPAEWSDEDEDNLNRVIRVLEDNDSDWKELSNWLKSLRPSWKPSEEQMEALRRAVNKLAKTDVADSVILSIMYDNLKRN